MIITEITRVESKEVRNGELRIELEANDVGELAKEFASQGDTGPLFKELISRVATEITRVDGEVKKSKEPITPAVVPPHP
jgi:hypothetical protein